MTNNGCGQFSSPEGVGPGVSGSPESLAALTNAADVSTFETLSIRGHGSSLTLVEHPTPPSLTLRFIVENQELVKKLAQDRGVDCDVDGIVSLATKRNSLTQSLDSIRAELNAASRHGRVDEAQRAALRQKRDSMRPLEKSFEVVERELREKVSYVPNLLHPEVPIGPESMNRAVFHWGDIPNFPFEVKDHLDIAKGLDLIDVDRGSKVAGRGFVFLKRELVLMRNALVSFFLEHVAPKGYIPLSTPVVSDDRILYGTGYHPWQTKENFRVGDPDASRSLIGTSEQVTIAQHTDEILDPSKLPIKYCAESQCFRTEAGAAGRDSRGMFRLHQFGKVEQIVICKPAEAEFYLHEAIGNQEWLCQQLGLPYRVLLMASQDIAPPGYHKFDIEIWMPGQNRYRELGSHSNLSDFQSRRLNIRYRDEETGGMVYPHTISAIGFSDRILIGILENCQQADGSVAVPHALYPYMGGISKITPRNR